MHNNNLISADNYQVASINSNIYIFGGAQRDRRKGSTSSLAKLTARAKALYTFEVQEAGELGFNAGEIITLLDDSHPDWWKGMRVEKVLLCHLKGLPKDNIVPLVLQES